MPYLCLQWWDHNYELRINVVSGKFWGKEAPRGWLMRMGWADLKGEAEGLDHSSASLPGQLFAGTEPSTAFILSWELLQGQSHPHRISHVLCGAL